MPTKTPVKKVTTKVAKKMPVKKVAPKKVATTAKKAPAKKEKQFKALVCAIDGECFWTTDGRVLQNLADLNLAFGTMDDEVFLHHVTKEKNDFADWVEYVLRDLECAADLRKAKKLEQAEKILLKHLNLYNVNA